VFDCHASFISGPFRSLVQFKFFCLTAICSLSLVLVAPLAVPSCLPQRDTNLALSKQRSLRLVLLVLSFLLSLLDGGPQSEISTSTVESSLETPDNPSQNSDGSLMSYLSTPDRSISTSRRVFKTRLPPNFPSRVTHVVSQRISSLPETAPLLSVKSQISSQQRIVTMPENIRSQRLEKEFVLYPPEYEDSPIETSNSFSMSDGNSSFARADVTGQIFPTQAHPLRPQTRW
jgi:hypothetical protein